jgi:D-threo-aldose 1-dehydrogenase
MGLGTAQLGNLYTAVSDEEAAAVVATAWDLGIRYYDTAPHYGLGLSELRLGAALSQRPREEFLVSTKVGRELVAFPGSGHLKDDSFDVPATHQRVWSWSEAGIRRTFEASLDRLNLSYVDIVYLHDPDDHMAEAMSSAIPALYRLRDEGLVRAIGVGMNAAAPLEQFVEHCDLDVVMVAGRLTLLDQSATATLLPLATRRGTAVVAAGVFNSGILAQPTQARAAKFDYGNASPETVLRAKRIASVCEKFGVTLPEAAVSFPFRFDAVRSVVLGARTSDQVRTNDLRAKRTVPDMLWGELENEGLLPPGLLTREDVL